MNTAKECLRRLYKFLTGYRELSVSMERKREVTGGDKWNAKGNEATE